MIIRQEEETPIGNYFHDNGILKTFKAIEDMVDEFDVDTERLKLYCDELSNQLKMLKSFVGTVEKASMKKQVQAEIHDKINHNLS